MIRFSKRSHPHMLHQLNMWSPFIAPLSWGPRFATSVLVNPFLFSKFLQSFVLLLAKLAHADGSPTQREMCVLLELLDREFVLTKSERDRAITSFFAPGSISFEECLTTILTLPGVGMSVRRCLFSSLLAMAYEENVVTVPEQHLLEVAVKTLALPPSDVDRIQNLYHKKTTKIKSKSESQHTERAAHNRTHSSAQDSTKFKQERPSQPVSPPQASNTWYEILGCKQDDTVRDIKRRYRALAQTYHPDHLPSSVPDNVKKDTIQRFLQVQQAYEECQRFRQF